VGAWCSTLVFLSLRRRLRLPLSRPCTLHPSASRIAHRASIMTRKETGYTRNPLIARGIRKYSGAAAARKNGRWLKKWKKVEKPAAAPVVAKRAPKWYPTEHVPRPIPSRKKGKATHTTLRSSITPGTVLIILAGRFAGRRVVFLKQLPSGLLLVTGMCVCAPLLARRLSPQHA